MNRFGVPEPDFFKEISNTSVCLWFYILFIINTIVAFIGIIGAVYTSMMLKGATNSYRVGYLLGYTIAITIPLINATFFYIMCNRALPQ
jgi:hypothetical protein